MDEDYDSGLAGRPGTRFVINLKKPPMDLMPKVVEKENLDDAEKGDLSDTPVVSEATTPRHTRALPDSLSVLFVDDDPILRKLFSRMVKKVAPGWTIREAASGEAALRLLDEDEFELIFMDMYMASVEKQLLGTETVEALRSKGVKSRICGLSANDKETEFLDAGADAFIRKPFPCEQNLLKKELVRILFSEDQEKAPDR